MDQPGFESPLFLYFLPLRSDERCWLTSPVAPPCQKGLSRPALRAFGSFWKAKYGRRAALDAATFSARSRSLILRLSTAVGLSRGTSIFISVLISHWYPPWEFKL